MTELMTSLVLVAYVTAAVVGIQLVASSVARFSSLVVRRNGRPGRLGEDSPPQAALAGLVFLAAGLLLVLQGVAVVLWTFG